MQFICASGDHTVVVRSDTPAIFNEKGQMLYPKKQRLFAKFRRGIPSPFMAAAQEHFPKWDRPERPLSLFGGFFDSEMERESYGWDDEELAEVERVLLTRPQVFRVELKKAAVPYRDYLKDRKVHGKRTVEHAIKAILDRLDARGDGPEGVVAYERDHEDEHSAAIIEAVTAVPPDADEEELVAA